MCTMWIVRFWTVAPLLLLVATAGGCGEAEEPTGSVTGRITYGGEPVMFGSVCFRDEQRGMIAATRLRNDGAYSLYFAGGTDIPVGEYVVTIEPPDSLLYGILVQQMAEEAAGKEASDPVELERRIRAPQPGEAPIAIPAELEAARKADYPLMPQKYRSTETSTLKATVNEGDNKYDFDLKK
jgi:hypothetical protein